MFRPFTDTYCDIVLNTLLCPLATYAVGDATCAIRSFNSTQEGGRASDSEYCMKF
jgi:hypothetical protein